MLIKFANYWFSKQTIVYKVLITSINSLITKYARKKLKSYHTYQQAIITNIRINFKRKIKNKYIWYMLKRLCVYTPIDDGIYIWVI